MTRSQAMWCLDFLLIYQVLENLIGFAQTGAHYELYSSPPIRYLFLTIFYTE
ncbi:MAG: hypothetical protein RLY60_2439 [Pseudomonadota bacterium]|jgi:hypothetical protein